MNNFDVLKEMSERNLDVRLAPLDNIKNLRKCNAGTDVTIGVAGDVVAAIGLEQRFVGGLILADKEQFNTVRSEISKRVAVRSKEQIEDEIKALAVPASDLDTELQSNDTCLAACQVTCATTISKLTAARSTITSVAAERAKL